MECSTHSLAVANQTFFKFIKRKITPAKIQKIMQKKDWFAPPALLAGGAASNISLEMGSNFVVQFHHIKSRALDPAFYMVPQRGLEPPRIAALVPETSVYTNFTTAA